jgi:predicted CXXCH cytochrome family protein
MGDTPPRSVSVLLPFESDSLSYEPGKILIVSVAKESGDNLTVSTQWEKVKVFDLREAGAKENFAKDFYKLFEPRTTIQMLTYSLQYFKGYTKPESLAYVYTDSMSIKRLWQRPEFVQLVKNVQRSSEVSDVLVNVRGWTDSTCTTAYDDPNNDKRALYKVQTHLIPGVNTIYCAPSDHKEKAVAYSTTLVMDAKPIADRPTHFHNSMLELSCATCHEGLPSSDNGNSMKADCNVCHKAMSTGASYLHAPAEMKECATCHSWSTEKKTVVVEKGVPTVCYDCHSDKQAQVDSSAFPHPVAGDCMTCHSTHGTEQKHILKQNVYSLCTSCHDEEKVNHPVGRHPLRFSKLANGEEISCVACHNPHGSKNESLLKAPGGRMGICDRCH